MRTSALAAAVFAGSGLSSFATGASVDAGTLATVSVDAPLYDPNLAADNGCDPSGCVGDLTRDGDATSLDSRWSCKPALGSAGSTCSITYALSEALTLDALNIALYKGDTRTRTLDVLVDGQQIVTWTSSGTTTAFETVDLGLSGQTIELQGVLTDSEWLSIMEVEILADDGDDSGPTIVEAGELGIVTTASDVYDTRLAAANGCDPQGCTAALTRDGDLTDASRWSCAPTLGGTCSISYDLGAARDLSELRMALYKGATRARTVEVYVDGALFATWTSSGSIDGLESIDLSGTSGTMIEIVGVLDDSEWLSIIETEIMVLSSDGVTLPPAPTPTPAPATVQPVTVQPSTPAPVGTTPAGELQTVGLLPLASIGVVKRDPYNLRIPHALKDGDMSTSYSCADHEWYWQGSECYAIFDMFGYRRIKQVKIALTNGAEASTDIRTSPGIVSPFDDPDTQDLVTSSGATEDFETYDFDYFAEYITVLWNYESGGQTMGIAEVEFIEEIQTGEVQINKFDYPFSLSTGSTTYAPEFISDSSEVLDEKLKFYLNYFAAVTSLLLQFPAGDTYKFDVSLYDHEGGLLHSQVGLESTDTTGWQSFDIAGETVAATSVEITIKGTGSGAPGFAILDARVIGDIVENPTDTFSVGSTNLKARGGWRYPDFMTEGTGDQKAIMGAICAVKKASFDGVDCVGGDDTTTGTVSMSEGEWFVDGNIFMKSGVTLLGRYYPDDFPYKTELTLEEGAAGKTDVPALVVMDGVSNAKVEKVWVNGRYFPESSGGSPAAGGLGSVGISIAGSQNVGLIYTEVNNIDGDGVRVHTSSGVNIDAGTYNEEWRPWDITQHRGTGIVVDSSENVWVRRYDVSDNGVAGIHIMGSNNFTFEATFEDDGDCSGYDCREGLFKGRVGSADGQQPIQVIVESSTLVKFLDMEVISSNDPVMTVSDSKSVSFEKCGFSDVLSGICVIQTDALSEVSTSNDPELGLDGICYVKV